MCRLAENVQAVFVVVVADDDDDVQAVIVVDGDVDALGTT